METKSVHTFFKDLDINFKMHPVSKQPSVVSNKSAITLAVKNLVLTNKYERFFNPTLYSDVLASLFESFDPIGIQILKNDIITVLKNFEPRASVVDIILKEDLDNNYYSISIKYVPLNSKDIETVDIFLERLR